MLLSPYLLFNGDCEEAFKFYEKAIGGKILMMMPHKGTPAEGQGPKDWDSKIIHARMQVGDTFLMGSDAPPDRYQKVGGFSVSLSVKTEAEADRIFAGLSDKAAITLPIGKTFFSPRFGMLTDKYGIPWMINCEPPAS